MDEHVEIERRFLVDARGDKPWRVNAAISQIEQYYTVGELLSIEDGTLLHEGETVAALTEAEESHLASTPLWTTRLRRRDGVYILTYKARVSDDTSLELEWRVKEQTALRILSNGPFPSVEKTRYVVNGPDGLTWEVDEFEGALAGLVLAEVELTSSEQSVALPSWVGHEITGLRSWSNRALAETLASRNN
ncbi:MAG: CYTH domain-containing protein [Candidatus Thermoplasmatota archaeon]|nr:CYTH domain-containing protein [Candidatus Thermoplasmatota archaeon]